jgi:hypothetical protein
MLSAQGLGEYAGLAGSSASGALGVESSSPLHNSLNWLQHSWHDDRGLWIAGIACVLMGMWFFSRRHG